MKYIVKNYSDEILFARLCTLKKYTKNGTIYVLPQNMRFLSTLEFIIHKLPLRPGNYRGLFRGGTTISYPLKF